MNWKQKYSEMGSRNKKTGKLNNYIVTRIHKNGDESFECSCPATLYRPWLQACNQGLYIVAGQLHSKESTPCLCVLVTM